jgi:hypothetical protein
MTATDRHAVVSHTIGEGGILSIRTVRGSVRVRGIAGEEARVEARYADQGDEESNPEDDGVLKVDRRPGELRVEVDETARGLRPALGILLRGGRPAVDFDVTMPHAAVLRLAGVSADLDVHELRGAQEIRTVSGDVSMSEVAGRISVQSVSGDVLIRGSAIALDGTTTSGDLSAVAERIESVRARSVSGDLQLDGLLDPAGEHTIESISGDLEIAPAGGVTIRMSGISGSFHSELPHRRESNGGRRSIVVGDGAASVTFRTMSGDLNLVRTSSAGAPELRVPAGSPMRPPDPPREGAPAMTSPPAAPLPPAPPSVPGPPDPPPAYASGPASDDTSAAATEAADELAVLRALERGEIDVDEAARRLEGVGTHA